MGDLSVVDFEEKALQKVFGANEGYWEYLDINGNFLCYTVRKRKGGDGKKYFLPFTKQDGKWVKEWLKDEAGEALPRPIYNINQLKIKPSFPVLIVEGEKAADAAVGLFPQFACVTWMGGSSTADKVDLTYLIGRDVYLVPDNDIPGYKAMDELYRALRNLGNDVHFVDIKRLMVPEKWDVANLNDEYGEVELFDVQEFIIATPANARKTVDEKQLMNRLEFPDLSGKEKPINTSDNTEHLINFYKIEARYNQMTHLIEFYCEGSTYSLENENDCFINRISNLCVRNGVPKVDLVKHLRYISDKNRYHPAIKFIEAKPWDGISRIHELINTVESDSPELARKLIYRWLISCVAALYLPQGIAAEGALVFQGPQYIGKTYWFLRLVPFEYRHLVKEGVSINVTNKDDLSKSINCWLVELGEISSTLKASEVEDLKNFITRQYDEFRPPYGEFHKKYPRRTIFYGSVNEQHFLKDPTGNRRYWVVPVNKINYNHDINMQQLWAEVKVLFDKGESFRLDGNERMELNQSNESFNVCDPIEEAILNLFDWKSNYRNNPMTCKEVAEKLGIDITHTNVKRTCDHIGKILGKITGARARQSNNKRVFDLPETIEKQLNDKSWYI